jgi:hypothetical protein
MKYCFIEIFKHFNLEQHKTKTHKKHQNYIIHQSTTEIINIHTTR